MRRALPALLVWWAAGCGTTVAVTPPSEPPARVPPPSLRDLVPQVSGFTPPAEVTVRTPEDIYEQINGASDAYLRNGMTEALFATLVRGGDGAEALELEVYRFKTPDGALRQLRELHGDDPQPWHGGSTALVHEFGVELAAGALMVRALFADGPAEVMRAGAEGAAKAVIDRSGAR